MAVKKVKISFKRNGQLKCTPVKVVVHRKDTVVWKISKNFPFAVLVKCPITPLQRFVYLTALSVSAPKVIEAKVTQWASPGNYPYAIGAYNGKRILYLDPEIIVPRPPTGR
jgi:hypothetical protein